MARTIKTDFVFNALAKGRGTEDTTDDVDDLTRSLDENAGAADGLSRASERTEGRLGALGKAAGMAGKLLAGGLVVGLGAAIAVTGQAFRDVQQLDGAMNEFSAATGITGEALEDYEGIAKNIFSAGWGDDLNDVVATMTQVRNVTGASGDELEKLTTYSEIFSDTFDRDVNETIRAADTVMENFGGTGTETFDLLTRGMQATGDPGQDLLDTFNEYSGNFAEMGFTAREMFSILESGLAAGARNTDDIADGMREFGTRLKEGASNSALWELGLDGLNASFRRGEATGEEMFDAVLEGLREIEDPIERNRLGVELFGTKWEDLGEEAFLALDKTSESLDDMEGATDKAGNALSRGLGPAWTRFTRTLRMGLASALAPYIEQGLQAAIPLMEDLGEWLTAEGIPAFVDFLGIVADVAGELVGFGRSIVDALGGSDAIVNFVKDLGDGLMDALRGIGDFVASIQSAFKEGGLSSVGQLLLDTIASGITNIAGWVKTNVIDKIARAINNISWTDVKGQLEGLYASLLVMAIPLATIAKEKIVDPLVSWAGQIDWKGITGTLKDILGFILRMDVSFWTFMVEKIYTPVLTEIGKFAWDAIPGALDTILDAIFSGAKSVATWVTDEIWTPLTTGLGDSTQTQNIATKAGEIAGKILSGLVSGLGDLASWVGDNVIQPIINALTGGGGESGGAGGSDASGGGKSMGLEILSGIASAFLNIGSWVVTNLIDPFVTGLTGENLAGLGAQGLIMGQKVLNNIPGAFLSMTSWVKTNVIDKIIGGFTEDNLNAVLDKAKSIGGKILDGAGEGIGLLADFLKFNVLYPLGDALINADYGAFLTSAGTIGLKVLEGIVGGLGDLAEWALGLIGDLVAALTSEETLQAIYNGALDLGGKIVDAIVDAITSGAASIAGAILGAIGDVNLDPFGGGGDSNDTFKGHPSHYQRDSGGRGYPGQAYVINPSAAPEVFVPDASGTFYPNADRMAGAGGGGTTIVVQNANFPGVRNVRDMQRSLERLERRQNKRSR